jgi:hypothetical protein
LEPFGFFIEEDDVSRKAISGFALALLFGAVFTASAGQRERLDYLGNAHVDGRADHDVIRVGRSDGRFRAIQLRVNGGAIEFDRVLVHFGNGTTEQLVIRSRIPSGGVTRAIDLPGERRVIESVELWYSKDNWRRRPEVRLYGIR